MARPQHTPVFPADNDDYDETATATGCGCFRRFCFGRDEEEGRSYLLREKEGSQPWVKAKIKKLRELSEMVAGPKWKNLIRKLGKFFNPRKHHDKTAVQFDQYSPESYALNFTGDDRQGDADFSHSFSTRFAPGYFINDHQRKPVQ
ncbi:hypothetical protein ACS0TY_024221 [Phlomoides rotata]